MGAHLVDTLGGTSELWHGTTASYFNAHQTATLCEKAIAREIGVEWKAYDAAVENHG